MSKKKNQPVPPPPPAPPPSRSRLSALLFPILPYLAAAAALAYIILSILPQPEASPFNLTAFGQLPVLHEGRIKPLETVARSSLMLISNRQTITVGDRQMTAVEWMLDAMTKPDKADEYPAFRVDQPDIQTTLTGPEHKAAYNYFSFAEMAARAKTLNDQFTQAFSVEGKDRNLYQAKLVELSKKLRRYQDLATLASVVPVTSGDLHSLAPLAALPPDHPAVGRPNLANPALAPFIAIVRAYHDDKPGDFNAGVAALRGAVEDHAPALAAKARFEAFFQHAEPFYHAMVLYVLVFLLAAISWLVWEQPLRRTAVALALVTLVLHTLGLATRVYLHGHPPVTNLYASSLFIGWACVILSLILELIYRNAIGAAMAGVAGFLTLLIAHNLSDGDNLEAVRAVLDTNLWLSTHVVVVTIGYASTFLAGFLAIIYVLRGVFTRSLSPDTARNLARMIYGIVCFAALASFVGTILGGIWADQSWGRFWGWDPKENGALLIVMMNVLILHARWGGMVRERGVAVLAIAGNIVTSWSWFGVNMLGIGLHSYGFMDRALFWLVGFDVCMLALMGIGTIPLRYWRSFSSPPLPLGEGGRVHAAG